MKRLLIFVAAILTGCGTHSITVRLGHDGTRLTGEVEFTPKKEDANAQNTEMEHKASPRKN